MALRIGNQESVLRGVELEFYKMKCSGDEPRG